MSEKDFAVVALFHIPGTNIAYNTTIKFANRIDGGYPQNTVDDIQKLITIINSKPEGHPYGGKCISIDFIIDTKNRVIRDETESTVSQHGLLKLYILKTEREAIEKALKQANSNKWELLE